MRRPWTRTTAGQKIREIQSNEQVLVSRVRARAPYQLLFSVSPVISEAHRAILVLFGEGAMEGQMHCDRVSDQPRDLSRSRERLSEHDDREARYWSRQLYEFKASDPDRWGHSGFKELYPEEFESDSEKSRAARKVRCHKRKKSKSETEASLSKRSKKSSRKKKKKKKKKDEEERRKCSSSDSSSDDSSATKDEQQRKKPKSRHKNKKTEKKRARDGDGNSSGSNSEEARERRTRRRFHGTPFHINNPVLSALSVGALCSDTSLRCSGLTHTTVLSSIHSVLLNVTLLLASGDDSVLSWLVDLCHLVLALRGSLGSNPMFARALFLSLSLGASLEPALEPMRHRDMVEPVRLLSVWVSSDGGPERCASRLVLLCILSTAMGGSSTSSTTVVAAGFSFFSLSTLSTSAMTSLGA
ncbi:putative protein C11orf57 [Liparis tanakae]|uniref:Uncharacterized protein n=1 Tax=Liparis tanakae TaxID=230148 RepID=A0A4Z2I586_9TELE|nr:putative protein C11orf57 [Liparis tanakae]